jgi:hypothetical protein
MNLPTPTPRGMALVMAMIVIVLMTLLVAGAISFTGTERAASEIQTQEDTMSSCVQAARNLFISKIEMLDKTQPQRILFDEDLRGVRLRTGHFNRLAEVSATPANTMNDPNKQKGDESNGPSPVGAPMFYTVTAVCSETNDPTSPEREIEFMVRVGF